MSDKEEFFERFGHAIIEMELKVLDDIWQWIEEKLKEQEMGIMGENYSDGYFKAIDDAIRLAKKYPVDTLIYELQQLKEK